MSDERYDILRHKGGFVFIKVQGGMTQESAAEWIHDLQAPGAFLRVRTWKIVPEDTDWALYETRIRRPAGF